jgi:hypothetical protein
MDSIKNKLTHEMLVTFLVEESAIVNSRPLVPPTLDPDDPTPLTLSVLLTQKQQRVTGIPEILDSKHRYSKQWKPKQFHSNRFWILPITNLSIV